MEFGSEFTDETFFHIYQDQSKVENKIIDFDIKNLFKLLQERDVPEATIDKYTRKVHEHYLDATRISKRAFGPKMEDNFQVYNWGLTLVMDIGLDDDKFGATTTDGTKVSNCKSS